MHAIHWLSLFATIIFFVIVFLNVIFGGAGGVAVADNADKAIIKYGLLMLASITLFLFT